ncbi:MAG TPA: RecQ family ATP-dependent DNA helicase [Vicinamibacterales bacterium]|jgi:ATP-dependent DNA helicase RecQ
MSPSHNLDDALVRLGYQQFRPGQRDAIETLLTVGRLLLVAPTGGGKSLIYQLPATLLPGTTVVISPLIALMQDQAHALEQRGVRVTYLSSTLEAGEMRRRMARAASGEFQLLYVAPERLTYPGFQGLLRNLQIPLVAVDEAHCISEWGHDFRPEYLQIGDLLRDVRPARMLACTATATPVVRDEILERLGLGADTPQILRGFARPNLILRALEISGPRERAVHVDRQLAEALGRPGGANGVAIVYSMTRAGAEEEAERLSARGWRATSYHAGLDRDVRARAQQSFIDGQVDIVAATVAFGMGIDRPDVRAVVHLSPPGSVEAYYQEVGRAGRDGDPAWGLLLVSPGDMALRRRLLERAEGASAETIEHKWTLFLELMRWAEGGSCRHDAILRYFGDEAETLAGCGRCDVCEALSGGESDQDPETATLIVRKALSGVARVHGRFGMTAAVQLLRGMPDERLVRAGIDRTTTFGVLKEYSEEWLLRLLRRTVTAGWIDFSTGDRPVVRLTDAGRAVMKADRPARLLLPPTATRRDRVAGRAATPRRGGPASRPTVVAGARAAGDSTGEAEDALFEALRRHRLDVARGLGVPPYFVASDRTLRELATFRPRTLSELESIYGIGPSRAERFGKGFLDVITCAD